MRERQVAASKGKILAESDYVGRWDGLVARNALRVLSVLYLGVDISRGPCTNLVDSLDPSRTCGSCRLRHFCNPDHQISGNLHGGMSVR